MLIVVYKVENVGLGVSGRPPDLDELWTATASPCFDQPPIWDVEKICGRSGIQKVFLFVRHFSPIASNGRGFACGVVTTELDQEGDYVGDENQALAVELGDSQIASPNELVKLGSTDRKENERLFDRVGCFGQTECARIYGGIAAANSIILSSHLHRSVAMRLTYAPQWRKSDGVSGRKFLALGIWVFFLVKPHHASDAAFRRAPALKLSFIFKPSYRLG
jgi:hypothetical protein